MIKKIIMENLMCTSCTSKIEIELKSLPYVSNASFNFNTQTMLLDVTDEYVESYAIKEIKRIVDSIETGVDTHLPSNKSDKIEKHSYLNAFLIGMIITSVAFLLEKSVNTNITLTLRWIGYILISKNILIKTIKGVLRKDYFNENTLMIVATVVAMLLGEFNEAVLVVLFYTFGEFLQNRAVKKSRGEIKGLVDLKIEYANVVINGETIIRTPEEINIDDVLLVKNGDKIPVDGIVVDGNTSINTSALTGESKLTFVNSGDEILSGNINVGSVIKIKATKIYKDSTVAKIIDLIENSTNNKANPENFITKFAKIYTPTVAVLALLMFAIPSLINPSDMDVYLYRAAIFLVISCPCALVLSIPLTYFSGIGASARNGILFKGSTYLDMLANVDKIAIDKTGTLTKGNFTVSSYTNDETLKLAASIESFSNHPIASSIVEYYKGSTFEVKDVKEISGKGMTGIIDGKVVLVGNAQLLSDNNIKYDDLNEDTTSVLVAIENRFIGQVIIEDEIRETAKEAIDSLKGIEITMLTGDNKAIASKIADELGISFISGLLPEQKIREYNNIKSNKYKMFVGDGINDAPLLKNADIGVAMGQGSEIAIDVADVIIMNNDLTKLSLARKISLKTKRIVYQNIGLTIGLKFLVVSLAAFGLSSMLAAILADVGVSLIAVMNSLRIIYSKEFNNKSNPKINRTTRIFELCSNITIYSILDLLSSKEYPIDDIYNKIKASTTKIKKNIDVLKKERIIAEKKVNGVTFYYLIDNNIKEFIKSTKNNLVFN
jgi:Cd2+/Zn2+-exporting ATPase